MVELFFEVPGAPDVPLTNLEGALSHENIIESCKVSLADAIILRKACTLFHADDVRWSRGMPAPLYDRLKTRIRLGDGQVLWQYFDGRPDRKMPESPA